MTNPNARIIAESLDPYKTKDPFHLRYRRLKQQRGRMPGQVKIRVGYKAYSTHWFDYLLVSRKEMKQIVNGTGWKIKRLLSSKGSSPSSRAVVYIAIIQREA